MRMRTYQYAQRNADHMTPSDMGICDKMAADSRLSKVAFMILLMYGCLLYSSHRHRHVLFFDDRIKTSNYRESQNVLAIALAVPKPFPTYLIIRKGIGDIGPMRALSAD